MRTINTNISSTTVTNVVARNKRQMSVVMDRLLTELRINLAGEGATGLAIPSRMNTAVSSLTKASKNTNDAILVLKIAKGSTLEISNFPVRTRELEVQSVLATYSNSDRELLDLEFGAQKREVYGIATSMTRNTKSILNSDNNATDARAKKTIIDIQLGAKAFQKVGLRLNDWMPSVVVGMQVLNVDSYKNSEDSVSDVVRADELTHRAAIIAVTENATISFSVLAANEFSFIEEVNLTTNANISDTIVEAAFLDSLAPVTDGRFDARKLSGCTCGDAVIYRNNKSTTSAINIGTVGIS